MKAKIESALAEVDNVYEKWPLQSNPIHVKWLLVVITCVELFAKLSMFPATLVARSAEWTLNCSTQMFTAKWADSIFVEVT